MDFSILDECLAKRKTGRRWGDFYPAGRLVIAATGQKHHSTDDCDELYLIFHNIFLVNGWC